MAEHFRSGQRVQIRRGIYEGSRGRILRFTRKQVHIELSDGRQVRIPQKSLEPPETPPPIPREYLPVPHLVTGQRVDVHRGKYEGDCGTVTGLTPCKVYVLLVGGNREVRIDKKSVRVVDLRTERRSQRIAGSTSRNASRNSDFPVPVAEPTVHVHQQAQSRVVTPPRPSTARYETSQNRSTPTRERAPRVVTPPRLQRPRVVSPTQPPRRSVQVERPVQAQPRGGRSAHQVGNDEAAAYAERAAPTADFSNWNTPVAYSGVSSNTRRSARDRIIASLPVITVNSPSTNIADHSRACAICQESFQRGDGFRTLPRCGHGYHPDCIDPWIRRQTSCPTCRQSLTDDWSLP